MNPIEAIFLAASLSISIGIDGWFLSARCDESPAIHLTGAVVGIALQAIAVSMPILVNGFLADESLRRRVKALWLGLASCLISILVMETSLLYGDSIGEGKWYLSKGLQCTRHAPWFQHTAQPSVQPDRRENAAPG
jgi:hypothetical protein